MLNGTFNIGDVLINTAHKQIVVVVKVSRGNYTVKYLGDEYFGYTDFIGTYEEIIDIDYRKVSRLAQIFWGDDEV